jgi:hypothetical protein
LPVFPKLLWACRLIDFVVTTELPNVIDEVVALVVLVALAVDDAVRRVKVVKVAAIANRVFMVESPFAVLVPSW